MAAKTTCRKCQTPLHEENRVPLWDGHDYCATCVEAASPRLLEYARNNDRLTETFQIDVKKESIRIILIMMSGGVFCIAFFVLAMISWANAENMGRDGAIAALLSGLCMFTMMLAIYIPGIFWGVNRTAWRAVPTVSVEGGTMTVTRPVDWPKISNSWRSVPLASCCWRQGKLSQDSRLRSVFSFTRSPAIIVVPRKRFTFSPWSLRTACGVTPEMREVWEAFFTLADVPKAKSLWGGGS